MIDRIPASHIALYSTYARDHFVREFLGRDGPTLGIELTEIDGVHHVSRVLRGSPADEAGIRRGDRLLTIDGLPVVRSDRLDPRHDDAAAPEERAHLIRVGAGESVVLLLERGGDGAPIRTEVELPVVVTSSLRSDRRGVRIVERDGVRVGVLPLTFIYARDTSRHTLDALAGPLVGAEALVLDLRGRGGSGIALLVLTQLLRQPTVVGDLPLVAAIDRRTRSAKEVLARDIRAHGIGTLVGERTPGAVRPARWLELGEDTWLLCPRGPIGVDRRGLEGRGVEPDIAVTDPFPDGEGADPILEAAIDEAARQVRVR